MQLRPRQKEAVAKVIAALKEHKNTLLVAPTGAGKTVMLGGAAVEMKRELGVKTGLVLQHRDELVSQNRKTFWLVDKAMPSDLYTADRKKWVRDGWTFGMAQTLGRDENLASMPPLQALSIDEAHHAPAPTYQRIIDRALKLNPDCLIFGVTATPNRGDKKALRGIFTNCADQITLRELIAAGFLVKPRTFVIDIGTQNDLKNVRKLASDFDMAQVEQIMDKEVLNDRIVEEWRKLAADRPTVVFCSTVAHAGHVRDAFSAAGVRAAVVSGEMGDGERRATLAAYDAGQIQVICNVAVLTEGWDHQPTSCVILLRPSSWKSTMVQMIGRGLRKVEPERYPGVVKDDCIVIDFGTSILTHGAIEDELDLEGGGTKVCPECEAIVPKQAAECPICGHDFPRQAAPTKTCENCGEQNGLTAKTCKACGCAFPEKEDERGVIEKFVLTEVDLLHQSPFMWETIFDGLVMVAYGFDAWAMIVSYKGRWHALGCAKEAGGVKLLMQCEDRILALASADDFMRSYADSDGARKTKHWLTAPATAKQCEALKIDPMSAFGLTRYRASCLMTWKWNEWEVQKKLATASLQRAA
jgi:DNA repair protein RadD